jgi:serine/threonine protein kinase
MKFSFNSAIYKAVDSSALDLLRRMLKKDPKDRIKASEILNHPFLTNHNNPESS